MRKINTWIGIDQTGSKKKLPLAVLYENKGNLRLELMHLPLFTKESFQKLDLPIKTSKTWITADCVFWPLYSSAELGMWKTFSMASLHRNNGNPLGRRSAQDFFWQIRRQKAWESEFPLRKAEQKTQSNSVFNIFPYQRNIQTGTYRIWSELGKEPWLNIWPFSLKENKKRAWIAEGYPTWFWKNIFNQKKRNPSNLPRLLNGLFKNKIQISPENIKKMVKSTDFADAVVLACGSYYLTKNNPSVIKSKVGKHMREGWILGLD